MRALLKCAIPVSEGNESSGTSAAKRRVASSSLAFRRSASRRSCQNPSEIETAANEIARMPRIHFLRLTREISLQRRNCRSGRDFLGTAARDASDRSGDLSYDTIRTSEPSGTEPYRHLERIRSIRASSVASVLTVRPRCQSKRALDRSLEERHLLAEQIRIYRGLAEPRLEVTRSSGTVTRKMIRDVPVDVRHLLGQTLDRIAPCIHFA